MTPLLWLALAALALPLLALLWLWSVTCGVWLNMRLARHLERGELPDSVQETVFQTHPRAPALARARGVLREGYWQSVAWTGQALHTLRPFRFPPPRPGGGLPVVLVGGYVENASLMLSLARRLAREGFQPQLLDLPSTFASIESNAAWLAERLAELRASSGYARVGYVGHSMGGVVGRACSLRPDDPGLALVVCMASPQRGTHLARFGAGQSARDMCPGSEFSLRYPPEARGHAPLKALIAREDNIVSPAWSAVLPETETLLLRAPLGHTGILFDAEAHEQVVVWLRQAALELDPLGAEAGRGAEQEVSQAG